MTKKSRTAQSDLNPPEKYTGATNTRQSDRQAMMLRMVSSYSIFLFVILVLFVHLYISDSNNARSQFQWQVKSTLMSNVELFETDLEIMEAYCRQLLQDNRSGSWRGRTGSTASSLTWGSPSRRPWRRTSTRRLSCR